MNQKREAIKIECEVETEVERNTERRERSDEKEKEGCCSRFPSFASG